MIEYLGDFEVNATVRAYLNTFDGNGASLTSTMTASSVDVYKDGSTTQRNTTSGYTLTKDFDSITGTIYIAIDTSVNDDAGFYAAGHDYAIMIHGATINSQTVNLFIGSFSIANRTGQANITKILGTAAATPATAGILEVDVKNINNVSTSAVTTIKAVQGLTTADTITTYTGDTKQTGDSYAYLTAAIAELTQGTPPITPTLIQAIMALYMALRNGDTVTSSKRTIKNDAGTVIYAASLADDGTTLTVGKLATGP